MAEMDSWFGADKADFLKSILNTRGGTFEIFEDSNKPGRYIVYADRLGFMRVGASLLRYGIEAKLMEGSSKAEAVIEPRLFNTPSELQELVLQMDERATELALRKRTMGKRSNLPALVKRWFQRGKSGENRL